MVKGRIRWGLVNRALGSRGEVKGAQRELHIGGVITCIAHQMLLG